MNNTHSMAVGYLAWIFGFLGAHRFYYGKQISGAIWFCTFGLLGVGWLVDFFLIPRMDSRADRKYTAGPINYSVAWLLLTYGGFFGLHRFYMGRWVSGLVFLLTFGLLGMGVFYDFWTLNGQIDELNRGIASSRIGG